MAALFHPIRTLKENLRQIGAAVNASREFSLANRAQTDETRFTSGIPL